MSLAKLSIEYEEGSKERLSGNFSGRITALFNPSQLAYSKSLTWSPVHGVGMSRKGAGFALQYQSATPATFTIELFFDTYTAEASEDGLFSLSSSAAPAPQSVLVYTDKVAGLATIDAKLLRPPICRLQWGRGFLFQGVLQQYTLTLALFLEDGTPVRATMNCTFMESPPNMGATEEAGHAAAPFEHLPNQYTIRPGDTLTSIAATLFGDGAQWRRIARANGIVDPRRLKPGLKLSIPKLR